MSNSGALDLGPSRASQRIYGRFAAFYDLHSSLYLEAGRRRLQKVMASQSGEKILELGVGTGLTLSLYPPGLQITGVDISEEMLSVARQRVEKSGQQGVRLLKMDAQSLDFPDGSFDKVAAFYVASVVDDPIRMALEMKRVCRKGGEIYLVNHFTQRNSFFRLLEWLGAPLAASLGWKSVFFLDEFLAKSGLQNAEILPGQGWGYWKIIKVLNA